MKKRIHTILAGSEGSAMLSALVAFVILLIGIAGFYTSVKVARDMVQMSQNLNRATEAAVEKFYDQVDYHVYTTAPAQFAFYPEDGTGTAAFSLRGAGKTATLAATGSNGSGETEEMTYVMHYYLPVD